MENMLFTKMKKRGGESQEGDPCGLQCVEFENRLCCLVETLDGEWHVKENVSEKEE